jgi:hypothetical protein
MTPFEVTLESDLKLEWQRFANEWLFPWHNLSSAHRMVDVDNFDGRRITLGGVTFEGSAQLVYWDAIGRYLNLKVHEAFRRWDTETLSYPRTTRRESIDGVQVLLHGFVGRIISESIRTDRALRGGGHPASVPPHDASGPHSGAGAEIRRLAEAHRLLIDQIAEKDVLIAPSISWSKRIENLHADHKGKIYFIIVGGSILVTVWKFLVG